MVVWKFMSLQHLRPYQNWNRLVAVQCCPIGKSGCCHMTWYPTQSHYPDPRPTSSCPILIMASTRLGNDKYEFQFDSTGNRTPDLPHARSAIYRFGHRARYYSKSKARTVIGPNYGKKSSATPQIKDLLLIIFTYWCLYTRIYIYIYIHTYTNIYTK